MNAHIPRHHPPDHLLLEHTSGGLEPAAHLVVACHLGLCGACRRRVQQLEQLGGVVMDSLPEAPMPEGALDDLMSRLDPASGTEAAAITSRAQTEDTANVLPLALRRALPSGGLALRRWLPGIRGMTLDLGAHAATARLVEFGPGVTVPRHDHEETELVLVLDGRIEDDRDEYRRGDLSVSEPGHVHAQRVDPVSACLALIVNQGPLIPLTTWGRVLKFLTGI